MTPKRRRAPARASRLGGVALWRRVDRLARAVTGIEVAFRRAEAKLLAEAGERLRALRTEAMEQLRDAASGRPGAAGKDDGRRGTRRPPRCRRQRAQTDDREPRGT